MAVWVRSNVIDYSSTSLQARIVFHASFALRWLYTMMEISDSMTSKEIEKQITDLEPWFYEFNLGNGFRTKSALPTDVQEIFHTRLRMTQDVVVQHFKDRLSKIQCIDVGCHEGFYSMAMASLGVSRVLGIDVREKSLAKAKFVADTIQSQNIEFEAGNCEDLSIENSGRFELSLFLGVMYHLENPMRCLRNIASITTDLCVIETQVVTEVVGSTEWGAKDWTRPYQGVLALIDESDEFSAGNAETGASPVATCPSLRALLFMLKQAGFRRVDLIKPPPGSYEQHRRGKRVVCAAYK